MIKTNSNFKIPRDVTVLLKRHSDPHLRGSIKRAFIQAIVETSKQVKEAPKRVERAPDPKAKKK